MTPMKIKGWDGVEHIEISDKGMTYDGMKCYISTDGFFFTDYNTYRKEQDKLDAKLREYERNIGKDFMKSELYKNWDNSVNRKMPI